MFVEDERHRHEQDRQEPREHAGEKRTKLGLALSGGGFRASFFHVGVLARLAELGLLRHVEVISAVSGGSIIAALYYLYVKRLLEKKPDDEIEDKHYVLIVRCIERRFLAAVQKNFRMRTFGNLRKSLRMVCPNYSESDRLGELFDELLYRPVAARGSKDSIEMRDLRIRPNGGGHEFRPREHNRRRKAKVPILILNATSLNTGHNWRFEASRMGEPPPRRPRELDADKNMRLMRAPSYEDIAEHQQKFELGLAVAASASVPGIFVPLAISRLYEGGVRVQLVDGGVHDNQGIQALLDERCTHFIVSDASAQLPDEIDVPTSDLAVVLRSNDILMDRVREAQMFALFEEHGDNTAFIHLRKGLPVDYIPWLRPDCKRVDAPPAAAEASCSMFGVHCDVQDLLSRARTDLDSFSEIEAQSLMLDAYLMSGPELSSLPGARAEPLERRWKFLAIKPWMERPTEQYLRHLRVAQRRFAKVLGLSRVLLVTSLVAALVLPVLLWRLAQVLAAWMGTEIGLGRLLFAVAAAVGFGLLLSAAVSVAGRATGSRLFARVRREIYRVVVRAALPALAFPFVWLDLLLLDRLFLRLGRVSGLEPPFEPEGGTAPLCRRHRECRRYRVPGARCPANRPSPSSTTTVSPGDTPWPTTQ